jgi:hypothetical protein
LLPGQGQSVRQASGELFIDIVSHHVPQPKLYCTFATGVIGLPARKMRNKQKQKTQVETLTALFKPTTYKTYMETMWVTVRCCDRQLDLYNLG